VGGGPKQGVMPSMVRAMDRAKNRAAGLSSGDREKLGHQTDPRDQKKSETGDIRPEKPTLF